MACAQFYTIREGDTLFTIANKFDTTPENILRLNPSLEEDNLTIGRRICVISATSQPVTCPLGTLPYNINEGDTLLSIALRFGTSIESLLATNPDIILLDEPISALDVANREIMKAELKAIQKKFNATMLFITHDQEEAFFLSDRIMIMNEGNVEQIDTPIGIYQNPKNAYVKEFVCDQLDKKYEDLLRYTGREDS